MYVLLMIVGGGVFCILFVLVFCLHEEGVLDRYAVTFRNWCIATFRALLKARAQQRSAKSGDDFLTEMGIALGHVQRETIPRIQTAVALLDADEADRFIKIENFAFGASTLRESRSELRALIGECERFLGEREWKLTHWQYQEISAISQKLKQELDTLTQYIESRRVPV